MSQIRFSLTTSIIVVAFCATGFAALFSPSQLWSSTLFTLSLGFLVTSLICVLFCRGTRRVFWAGFAICGSAYYLASLGPWIGDVTSPHLLTTAMLDIVYAQIAPPPLANPNTGMAGATREMAAMLKMMQGGKPVYGGYGGMMRGSGSTPEHPPQSRWAKWTEPDRRSGVGGRGVNVVVFVSPSHSGASGIPC